jgi:hypothetical protein
VSSSLSSLDWQLLCYFRMYIVFIRSVSLVALYMWLYLLVWSVLGLVSHSLVTHALLLQSGVWTVCTSYTYQKYSWWIIYPFLFVPVFATTTIPAQLAPTIKKGLMNILPWHCASLYYFELGMLCSIQFGVDLYYTGGRNEELELIRTLFIESIIMMVAVPVLMFWMGRK